jgi:hypothetical protein
MSCREQLVQLLNLRELVVTAAQKLPVLVLIPTPIPNERK